MTSQSLTVPSAARGRGLHITLWVLQILLAAFFIFAGVNKLLGLQPEIAENFGKIGLGQGFRYLTGFLELAGGVGLLIPRLSGLAALGLAGVMVGAGIAHFTRLPPASHAALPALLVVIFAFIAWGRWPQTRALFGK